MINRDDKQALIEILEQNPDLPVIFFVNNQEIAADYGSTIMNSFTSYISEVYTYDYYGDTISTDDYYYVVDYYRDILADNEDFVDLLDPEYDDAVKEYVDTEVEHYKAIIISIS